jgi:hypothetical protein
MQPQMKLKINYWPILRTPNVSQNSLDGNNNDQLIVELNNEKICNFRLEKVNVPSNIYGHEEVIDIDWQLEKTNTLVLKNKQKWEPTGESINLVAELKFTPIKQVWEPYTYTEYELDFKYDLTELLNENFTWRAPVDSTSVIPLIFEFEEFGNVKTHTAIKFIQGLRFTIYKEQE